MASPFFFVKFNCVGNGVSGGVVYATKYCLIYPRSSTTITKIRTKIAEYILKNTETVISMNAQELAKQAGSSPAAIIRFCHSMDVNGFTELKLLLSANLGQMKQQMYTEVTKGESTADIKQKLQARFVHVVERSGQTLEDVAVNEAVDLLEKQK